MQLPYYTTWCFYEISGVSISSLGNNPLRYEMEVPHSSHPRQQQLLFQSARTSSHHNAPPACCTTPSWGCLGLVAWQFRYPHGTKIQRSQLPTLGRAVPMLLIAAHYQGSWSYIWLLALEIWVYIFFLHTGIPVTTSSERSFLLQTIEKVTIHSTPAFCSFSVFSS